MKPIAIIPARGGSKRIPRKNLKSFLGKPIIAYSVENAIASNLFARVVVSTDDQEIAEVAAHHGAEIPFLRPTILADDHTGTQAVVQHAIDFFSKQKIAFEHVCCLYATAPLLTPAILQQGYELLVREQCDFVVTVTEFSFPVQRALVLNESGYVTPLYAEYMPYRSQDLPRAYHDAGQVYWGSAAAFMDGGGLWDRQITPLILPRMRVQDIDTEEDWQVAETKYRVLNNI